MACSLPFTIVSDPKMRARLLYPNPVCILACRSPPTTPSTFDFNAMILSWLTPINNDGDFIFSINKSRFTAQCLRLEEQFQRSQHPATPANELLEPSPSIARMSQHADSFTLSIPVMGMESMVLSIGSCSGRDCNKFTSIPSLSSTSLQNILPSSLHSKLQLPTESLVSVEGCVACIVASITSVAEADRFHWLVTASIRTAIVREDYWNGKQFAPKRHALPLFLTFLGTKRFGYVSVVDHEHNGNDDNAATNERSLSQLQSPVP
jgi:flavin reductase (DIM6/NTAB) family NADH-FMN oxidoreductase RutF